MKNCPNKAVINFVIVELWLELLFSALEAVFLSTF